MTTVQLAMRLCECLTTNDFERLPLREAEKLREALQAGLSEFASLLPPHRQRRQQSCLMRAPLVQDIQIVQGSAEFAYVAGSSAYPAGGYAREEQALGMLSAVGSEVIPTRLSAPGTLARPYLGGSGDTKMTLYGDAAQMGNSIWHISSDPVWISGGQSQRLIPRQPRHEIGLEMELGTPRYYWPEELAGSTRASGPLWMLRVWPVPAVAGVLEMTVSGFCAPITFLDLHDEPRALPVAPEEESWLVALCEEALLKHPLWREDIMRSEIRQSAESARSALAARNRSMTTTPNRVGTPQGW